MARAADVLIARGEGTYLYGDTGTRLLDAVAGYGVASLGHSDPRWVEAVVGQARRLTTTSLYTAELGTYLESLAGLLPTSMRSIALSSTGTEAVEMAMRLAQTAQGCAGVLTFGTGFHGKTAAVRYTANPQSNEASLLAPQWLATAAFPVCQDHDAVDYSTCSESVTEDIAAIAARTDLQDVGAVLVEPVLGTAGNIPPKRQFLAALRELCTERGWLLIFDESITGFGRTGDLFAFETFAVQPDILVLSKGLGGGFPLSAVCAAPELWKRSALDAPSATSSSYGGNPIACAAGLATLKIVTDPRFLEQVRVVGAQAALRLRRLAERSAWVARPRGVGLMLGFDLVDPATATLASPARCEAVFHDCRDRGLLIAANVPRVRVNPPLTVTASEVDFLFDVLDDVL
jgi:4-aminobutyrate aminotransferase-like enzyme